MAQQSHRLGGNVGLASLLALLSYVPFEVVAKGSLVVCAFLFIVDPIPPLSRILAIVSLLLVNLLSKLHSKALKEQEEQGDSFTLVPVAKEEEEEENNKKQN